MIDALKKHRITWVWLLLIAATVLSFELGHGLGIDSARVVSVVVIIIALVKVRLMAFEFMELRYAPRFMQVAANVWLLGIGAVLIGLYWVGV